MRRPESRAKMRKTYGPHRFCATYWKPMPMRKLAVQLKQPATAMAAGLGPCEKSSATKNQGPTLKKATKPKMAIMLRPLHPHPLPGEAQQTVVPAEEQESPPKESQTNREQTEGQPRKPRRQFSRRRQKKSESGASKDGDEPEKPEALAEASPKQSLKTDTPPPTASKPSE